MPFASVRLIYLHTYRYTDLHESKQEEASFTQAYDLHECSTDNQRRLKYLSCSTIQNYEA
jgi:hypothetical protein